MGHAIGCQDTAPFKYLEVIKRPMDLALMEAKFLRGDYKCSQTIRDDCELMVRNALVFDWGAKVGNQ